jgi:hypothetical protein
LETFEELLKESSRLDIFTQKNSAAEQFMSSGSNKVLKQIQEISDKAKLNFVTEITETVLTVLNYPNKVFFSDMAYFVVQIYPPSGNVARKYMVQHFLSFSLFWCRL